MVNLEMDNIRKNIMPILALIWSVVGLLIFILIGLGLFEVNDSVLMLIINMISNPVLLILGYYFGSSEQLKLNEERNKEPNILQTHSETK